MFVGSLVSYSQSNDNAAVEGQPIDVFLRKTSRMVHCLKPLLSKNDKPIRKPGKHLRSSQDSLPAREETTQELIHFVE